MKLLVRLLVVLVLAGLVFGGVIFFDAFRSRMIAHYLKAFSNPVQTVSAMQAVVSPWQSHVQAVASLRALNGADLSADIGGIVDQINFQSGQDVAAGTILVTLRREDDPARLQQLQAAASLAQTNYARDARQLKDQAVSRAAVDTDLSTLRSAQAAVAQQQATMQKKSIVAPFAGRLGIRQIDLGQYVPAGTTIVALQALDPIYADFYVQQSDIDRVKVGATVTLTLDAYPGRAFAGSVESINSRVDAASRALQVRARFANPGDALLPGMFATVSINVGTPEALITLPQTAVSYNPYGSTVYLVEKPAAGGNGLVARQVFVQTGDTRGDQVAVTKGLQPGQTVVTAGQVKLHNGSPILINNSVTPSNSPDAAPEQQ